MTANANIQFSPGTRSFSTAQERQRVIATTAGRLLQCKISNFGPAQYLQFHDSKVAIVNGDIPMHVIYVPPNGTATIHDMSFDEGIAVCNSSTIGTATLGAANCWFYAEHK